MNWAKIDYYGFSMKQFDVEITRRCQKPDEKNKIYIDAVKCFRVQDCFPAALYKGHTVTNKLLFSITLFFHRKTQYIL